MKINKENRWTIEEIETELGHNYSYEINFLEAIFLKADWSIDFLGMTNSDDGSLQRNVTRPLLKNVTTPLIS